MAGSLTALHLIDYLAGVEQLKTRQRRVSDLAETHIYTRTEVRSDPKLTQTGITSK